MSVLIQGTKIRIAIKLLLLAAGVVLTNHEFVRRIDYFLKQDLFFPLAVFLGIWIAALAALAYVAFTPRRVEQYAWSALIGLAAFVAEAHYLITGDRITIQALDAMWDPGLFRLEMVGFYGGYFLQALLSTLPLLAGLLIPPLAIGVLQWRALVLVPFAPCLLLAGLVIYVGASGGYETRGLPSQFLNLGLFTVFAASERQPLEKQEVDLNILEKSTVKNIVLIVDESISGDFIDLNRPRGTTPYLASQGDITANFGLAISATNCSYSSNAILRLGADPRRIGEADHLILAHPTIWKYARKAGFETTFIEAQHISERRQYYMNDVELALIDHVLTVDDGTRYERDLELAERLAEVLDRPGPQFVYVNKYGAHFPYDRSYPVTEERFSPAMEPMESIADRRRLVNSYKNAVRWAVDEFFSKLLPGINLYETVLIYTSDHGQNLLDDGKPVTHCRRNHVSESEAVVPLLLLTRQEDLVRAYMEAARRNHNRASHYEVFPTLLALFGYDPVSVEKRYFRSLLDTIDQPLGFISGPVTGRFGRKAAWQPRGDLESFER